MAGGESCETFTQNSARENVKTSPTRVWGGPVEPATLAKVEAPLNGSVLWKGLPRVHDPALVPEAPIGLIKKASTNVLMRMPAMPEWRRMTRT